MLNKQKVQSFRGDFEKAVAQLEKQYGVAISLGTIRFDSQELRTKMTVKVGEATPKSTREDFKVGDMVGIDHKKISPNETFKITKINSKNIKVQGDNGSYTVSPNLLVKKTFKVV